MRIFRLSLFMLLLCASVPAFAVCLNGGTDATIQAALGTTAGAEAVLCQGSVFSIYNTIKFTANGQKIYTEGLPVDITKKAVLEAKSGTVVAIIDGLHRSNVHLRSVTVDGNREIYGFVKGDPLIKLGGNASGQLVDDIAAFEPRAWSVVHFWEGSPSYNGSTWSGGCTNATMTNSWIANAGMVDAQGHWADGVSLACRNSYVANNIIQNATDGAIVVFAAPGSIVENNTVEASVEVLGGIHLVASTFNGDFTGTIVRNNTIRSTSPFPFAPYPYMRVGIAIGPRVWHSCSSAYVKNGTVTGNSFEGAFGYLIAVDGAVNFNVTGNTTGSYSTTGNPANSCDGWASGPGAFKKHTIHSTGTYQSNFVEGKLHNAAAITSF